MVNKYGHFQDPYRLGDWTSDNHVGQHSHWPGTGGQVPFLPLADTQEKYLLPELLHCLLYISVTPAFLVVPERGSRHILQVPAACLFWGL